MPSARCSSAAREGSGFADGARAGLAAGLRERRPGGRDHVHGQPRPVGWVPVGWLWVGSQLQNSSSLATAIGTMMIGMLLTIVALIALLGWLNRKYMELQEARGRGAD